MRAYRARICFYRIANRKKRHAPNSAATALTAMQSATPHNVGIKNDAAVHLKLCVSFLIVISVVEHGQWNMENSIVHSAVTHVQPFATSKVCSEA